MDGAVPTLAPIFAAAGLTGKTESAFFVGLAASLGAGVSPKRYPTMVVLPVAAVQFCAEPSLGSQRRSAECSIPFLF
jgi:hypothetical protein